MTDQTAFERWDEFVNEHNSCEQVDDCVAMYPQCPLGCWGVVAKEHEDAAHRRAKQIRLWAATCEYKCFFYPYP